MKLPIVGIQNTLTLYRCDKVEPPHFWSVEHKDSFYFSSQHGHKNKANFYFFTDSIDIARSLGMHSPNKTYFLTETTCKSIRVIDFSICVNLYQMIAILENIGIKVMTDNFKTYEVFENSTTLEIDISQTFRKWLPFYNKGTIESIKNIRVGSSTSSDIDFFGQRLTDFDNGISFLNEINRLGYNIDGYRWREHDERGLTYCLFNAEKLSLPKFSQTS
jgi:hypothetical protein